MIKGLLKSKWGKIISLSLPVISVSNFLFPFVSRYAVRKFQQQFHGYRIEFAKLSLSSFSNKLCISKLRVYKFSAESDEPMVSIKQVEIKFSRTALCQNRIECDVQICKPGINFEMHKSQVESGNHDKKNSGIDIPIILRHIKISEGQLNFTDTMIQPPLRLHIDQIDISGSQLSTINDPAQKLPGQIEITAKAYEGSLKINIKTNLAVSPPLFDMDAEVRMINMVRLNELFMSYAKFEVSRGSLSLFAEAASAEGRFKGYVKPIIENLEVAGPQDEGTGFWHRLWENLLDIAASFLESDKENKELATKVPLDGTLKNPHVHVGYAVIEVLRNAFITALKPSIDHEISIRDVSKRA